MTELITPTDADRVADALFRGVSAQLSHAVILWLALDVGQVLVCERDEDADTIDTSGPRPVIKATQVKAETGRVSARSSSIVDAIRNFATAFHRYHSDNVGCEFVFLTTAGLANQRTDDQISIDVLARWTDLACGDRAAPTDQLVGSITALLAAYPVEGKNPARSARVAEAVAYLDLGHWDEFLRSVRWIFGHHDHVSEHAAAMQAIAADERLAQTPPRLMFCRLLVEVLTVSARPEVDERVLTRERLAELALMTKGDLERWLTSSSDVVARLDRHEREIASLRATRVQPRPPAVALPPSPVRSARLDEAVAAVAGHRRSGARIVALRGAPGDGKTQVARQLAHDTQATYWELPNAADADPGDVWRVGLVELATALGGEASVDQPIDAVARTIRERVGLFPSPHLLILDNADREPPIDLLDLLADGATCVAVGAGAVAAAQVSVRAPTPAEFAEIVEASAGATTIRPPQRTMIEAIGSLVDCSPLLAGFVAERLASDLELRDLHDELSELQAEPGARMQRVFRKTWNHLSPSAARLATVLGAWAEPDVPLAWIPQSLRAGDAIQALIRSHLIGRTADGEGLRLHRLVIQWIRSTELGSLTTLIEVLGSWAADPHASDELKAGGRRKLALVRGFELAHARGVFATVDPADRALLESTYVDQSTVFGSDPATVERRTTLIAPDEASLERLHPAVLGQLVDALRLAVINGHPRLQRLRTRGLELLAAHVERIGDDATVSLLDLIAEHHHGKHLLHANDHARNQEGLAILRRADHQATRLLDGAVGLDRAQLLVRRTKTRTQMCDQQASPLDVSEAIEMMRTELANEDVPEYLRLVAGRQLLRRAGSLTTSEIVDALRRSLDLLPRTQHDDVTTLFLSEAAKIAGMLDGHPILGRVEDVLDSWLRRMETQPTRSRRGSFAVAFASGKLSESFTDANAMTRLARAVRLLERILDAADPYHRQRAIALLREAGALEAAAALADRDADVDWYYTQYEVAETWRWRGDLDRAEDLLTTMAASPKNARSLGWIHEELARVHAKRGDLRPAAATLERNVQVWRDLRETAYADRCSIWLRATREGRTQAEDGLLADEWRCGRRRQTFSAAERAELDEIADQVRHRVLAAPRRRG